MLFHLHQYVVELGPLEECSTISFENLLGKLKRRIKQTKCVYEHCVNQILKLRDLYKKKSFDINITTKSPNNFCIINGVTVEINQIEGDFIVGIELIFVKDLYNYPYNSSILKIGCYQRGRKVIKGKPTRKCMCIQEENYLIIIPFVI